MLDRALTEQFDGVSDIDGLIKAIRWREIYQHLEDAADRADDRHALRRLGGALRRSSYTSSARFI